MSKVTVIFGILLCGLTVAILIIKQGVGSPTVFIPTFVGVPLILLGLISEWKPDLRKHLMHAAVTVGLLGGLAALGRGIPQILKIARGEEVDTLATGMVWSMTILCFIFVGLCVQSFIVARKARTV